MLDNNILAHYGKIEYWEERYTRYDLYNKIIFNIDGANHLIGIKYIVELKTLLLNI